MKTFSPRIALSVSNPLSNLEVGSRKVFRILFLAGLILLAGSLFDGVAQANIRGFRGARGQHHNRRGYSGRSGYSAVGKAYADIVRANAIRSAAIRSAQAEVSRTHFALQRTRTKLEREFRYSTELTTEQASLTQANRELDAARQAVRDRLDVDPKYRAAKAEQDRTSVSRMQAAEYKADTEVQAALGKVHASAVKITALKNQFEGSITGDPQWNAARASFENARIQLAQAHAAGNRSLLAGSRSRTGQNPHR